MENQEFKSLTVIKRIEYTTHTQIFSIITLFLIMIINSALYNQGICAFLGCKNRLFWQHMRTAGSTAFVFLLFIYLCEFLAMVGEHQYGLTGAFWVLELNHHVNEYISIFNGPTFNLFIIFLFKSYVLMKEHINTDTRFPLDDIHVGYQCMWPLLINIILYMVKGLCFSVRTSATTVKYDGLSMVHAFYHGWI